MDILIKRLRAYIIDLIIVILILIIIALLAHPNITNYQNELNNLSSEYFKGKISLNTYLHENSKIMKIIDTKNIFANILNIIIIVIYFIIIPYLTKTTIGKKINHIKIKDIKNTKLTLKQLTIRSAIINGLFYFISVIICTIVIPANHYFSVISIISFIQILLLIISISLIFKRKDKRGLHEILSQTYIK